MRSPRVLAVDLGAEHVTCGMFSHGATGRLVLERFSVETMAKNALPDALWQNGISSGLGALFGKRKIRGALRLTLPAHLTFAKFVRTPSVALQKRASLLAFEAAENIPQPLNEVVWDGVVLTDDGFDAEVILAAAKLEPMRGLCASADTAGVEFQLATPAPFALRDGFRYNHPEADSSILLANVGARSTTLLLLEGERFVFRTFPLGSDGIGDAAAGPNAADRLTEKVRSEIARSLPHLRTHSKIGPPTALYVSGGELCGPQIARLADQLRVPAHRYEPLRNVDVSADARAAGADVCTPGLAELVGLAAGGESRNGSVVINLLPPQVIAAATRRRSAPWLVAAAAVLMLALLPPLWRFDRLARLNHEQVARVDERLRPLRVHRARNAENLRELEIVQAQVTALGPVYDARHSWVEFLDDLQTHLGAAEDMWLDRLQLVAASGETSPSRMAGRAETGRTAGMRIALSGRLLDATNPQSRVSQTSADRVQRLLTSLRTSRFVAEIENERFENVGEGLLRFDFTLVLNAPRSF